MLPLRACFAFVVALVSMLPASLSAQDNTAARHVAADRYLRAVPVSKTLNDIFGEFAKQIPEEQRSKFLTDVRAAVRADSLEVIVRNAMVQTFTADELNALADFYSSPHGASAISKLGPYMAAVTPPLMQEVQRAMQEIREREKR